jgi:ribosomal protein L11 methyltransferase
VLYPALDIARVDDELALAVVDSFSPTAVEPHEHSLTVFFVTTGARDAAQRAILDAFPRAVATSREVDDEDWARRSQQNLQPVTVGRLTIVPRAGLLVAHSKSPIPHSCSIVIEPSMGFGTGHHATTRLCLAALQTLDLNGAYVVDAGTGSGVIAMAARRLGAREAIGIDNDADAVRSAEESLRLNPDLDRVSFEVADLSVWLRAAQQLQSADVVTANLTGALLVRSAPLLLGAVRAGGNVIVSGIMETERSDVSAAFAVTGGAGMAWERAEDEWVAMVWRTKKR